MTKPHYIEISDSQDTLIEEASTAEGAALRAQQLANERGEFIYVRGAGEAVGVECAPSEEALGRLIATASRERLVARDELSRASARAEEAKRHHDRLLEVLVTLRRPLDIPFESATDVASIELRLHPLDVGFDLREAGTAVQVTAAPTLRCSYPAADGERRVMSGPMSDVLDRLRELGFLFLVQAPKPTPE